MTSTILSAKKALLDGRLPWTRKDVSVLDRVVDTYLRGLHTERTVVLSLVQSGSEKAHRIIVTVSLKKDEPGKVLVYTRVTGGEPVLTVVDTGGIKLTQSADKALAEAVTSENVVTFWRLAAKKFANDPAPGAADEGGDDGE